MDHGTLSSILFLALHLNSHQLVYLSFSVIHISSSLAVSHTYHAFSHCFPDMFVSMMITTRTIYIDLW